MGTRTSSSSSTPGARGSRQAHVEGLLAELSGAEAALAVNNCAGAVLLAAAALGAGRSVIVSRGQLIEIGGGFRIPEVVAQSGARLVEVGTTNRTRLSDYERALAALDPRDGGVILRAHASNYRVVGFTEEVSIEALCGLGVPVIDDAGSGNLAEDLDALAGEPPVRRSVAAGCALVCFSGDKLLGGPQAGLLVGRSEAVAAARAHPLARALRIDKLSLAALEATLRSYRDPERARRELPVLAMLAVPREELERRAERLRAALEDGGVRAETVRAIARVGGGALPLLELEGPAVAVDPSPLGRRELARRLRAGDPPVIARIERDAVLLDPRTMSDEEAAGASRRGRGGAAMSAPLTLGTAGHIDHGKTALIRALTGVDTDRLPEERFARNLDRARLREPRAAFGPPPLGDRRTGSRALRTHDGRRARRASTSS